MPGPTPTSQFKPQAVSLTLFLNGYHPVAMQGGVSLFDDVSVLTLGPRQ
jgi:hypothetical protein